MKYLCYLCFLCGESSFDERPWDTTTLPPGDYTLRILAADIRGNEAIANRDVPITISRQLFSTQYAVGSRQ